MDLKYLIDKWGEEFKNEIWYEMPYSQYSNLSSMLLYAVIRENKYKNIFELGCERKSRSSFIIQKALLKNGNDFKHYMCDFPNVLQQAILNLFDVTNVEVVPGDVTKVEFDYSNIDFMFIDAHHEKWFCAWYLDNIIPQLKNGSLVHIHDIYLTPDWKNRMDREMETEELIDRHNNKTLNIEKLLWMEDYTMNFEYKKDWVYIQKNFPFIGDFPAPVLPHGDGTTYWVKK
jgi:predicted O-methyltransferase YrrM